MYCIVLYTYQIHTSVVNIKKGQGSPIPTIPNRRGIGWKIPGTPRVKAMNTALLTSILLNLMEMELDHYVAIIKPLHYPVLMNNKRRHFMIVVFWTVSLLLRFSNFLVWSERI